MELNEFSQCVGISLILDFKSKSLLLTQVPTEALLTPPLVTAAETKEVRLQQVTLGVSKSQAPGAGTES